MDNKAGINTVVPAVLETYRLYKKNNFRFRLL